MKKNKSLSVVTPKTNIKKINNNQFVINNEDFERLGKEAALFQSYVDELKTNLKTNQIDYFEEKENFFKQCSRNSSKHTRRQYKNALKKLETYCIQKNKNMLFFKGKDADDFITDAKLNADSNAYVRALISSCSSFFSFLERRYEVIKNPFRGTKTRPPIKNKKKILIPSKKEIDLIMNSIQNNTTKFAVLFIRDTGVRIGSLSTIEIKKDKYYAYSKGKNISGRITPTILKEIKKYSLDTVKPFSNKSSEVIRTTFNRAIKDLYTKKIIKEKYSPHDLRHYFAVKFYKKTKDIYLLKQALNHSSISITELYLKSLDVEE